MAFNDSVRKGAAVTSVYRRCFPSCVQARQSLTLRLSRGAGNRSSATGKINSSIVSDRNVHGRKHLQGFPTLQSFTEGNQGSSEMRGRAYRLVLPRERQVGDRTAALPFMSRTAGVFGLCAG